ncbi:PHP domain protein, partial [Vibrio parahaemolyticus V-223/04]
AYYSLWRRTHAHG